jgi:hypothetical protein
MLVSMASIPPAPSPSGGTWSRVEIDDEFFLGFTAHQIIKLYVAAGDIGIAKRLFGEVEDDFIREQILESSPIVGQH